MLSVLMSAEGGGGHGIHFSMCSSFVDVVSETRYLILVVVSDCKKAHYLLLYGM